jgi:ectoine hydroxylase-related dioxygenase (phytanoyl-CoA dioxygenase family)
MGDPARAASAPLKSLRAEDLARYREEGFLSPVPAIGPDAARGLRAKVEAVEARNGGTWPRHQSLKAHLVYTWLDAIVRHPAILDVVEDIVGPDILCWSSRFFIKDPNDGGFVSWHQDVPYWGLDVSGNILSAWLAVSPATRENGVMKVVPGSHRALVRHKEGVSNNLLLRGQEVAVTVDESQAVYMELAAGEMSLHQGLMFHGSEESRGGDRRIGFAIRYMPAHVKPVAGLPRDSVTLVRGRYAYDHFDLESPPAHDLAPDAVERHRRATETYARINKLAVQKHLETVGQARGAT